MGSTRVILDIAPWTVPRKKLTDLPSLGEHDFPLQPDFPSASEKERPPRPHESCTPLLLAEKPINLVGAQTNGDASVTTAKRWAIECLVCRILFKINLVGASTNNLSVITAKPWATEMPHTVD